jgi:hypothetical protein
VAKNDGPEKCAIIARGQPSRHGRIHYDLFVQADQSLDRKRGGLGIGSAAIRDFLKEDALRTKVGLWIDHRKATIVSVTDKGEELVLVVSKVEKHPERSGDSPMKGRFEARQVPADDSRQRTHTGHLNIYYEAVLAALRDAESILIFGPGEAKGELKTRLEKSRLRGRVAAVETVDKMTDRQISSKIRKYFTE